MLKAYAKLCGKVPARAHATTGDAEMISDCLGKSDVIDSAIARFAVSYADQTEKDYSEFMKGIKSGKLSIRDEPVHEDGSI